jgi:hypothetical protein
MIINVYQPDEFDFDRLAASSEYKVTVKQTSTSPETWEETLTYSEGTITGQYYAKRTSTANSDGKTWTVHTVSPARSIDQTLTVSVPS